MATPTDDNPFAPPTPSPSSEPGARLVPDENPFESALESVPLHAPRLDGVSSIPPDAAAVAARERELARREARLAEEERDISAREADARARATNPASRSKNFPSCFPLLRHDLDDFAPSNRPLMRAAHYAWLLTASAYVWNALVMTAAALVGVNETRAGEWILAVAFAGFFADAAAFAPGFGADLDAFESFPMSPSVVGVFALLFFVDFAFERPAVSAPALAAAFSAPAASAGCRAGSAVVSADPSEDGGSAGALLREGFLSCCSTPLVSKSCGVKIGGREGERAVAMRAPRGGTRATTLQARPGKSDSPRTHLHRRRTTLALTREGRGRRRDRG